jgi:hypothetical protein
MLTGAQPLPSSRTFIPVKKSRSVSRWTQCARIVGGARRWRTTTESALVVQLLQVLHHHQTLHRTHVNTRVHSAPAHRTPHTAHRTPHTAHRTPHTAHRTPHTAHRTPGWAAYGIPHGEPHRVKLVGHILQRRRGESGCKPVRGVRGERAYVCLTWLMTIRLPLISK